MTDNLFTDLDLPGVIDTASMDFIEEFYTPLLSRSTEYKRGVGFFSSSWVNSAARGISELVENGGTAKWLTSPILDEVSVEAFQKGEEAKRDEAIRDALSESITNLEDSLSTNTKNALAWLIADGVLQIRFVVPDQGLAGDFHDKWGIFYDNDANRVAFHGSQNDSHTALTNYESYDVFCDWRNEVDAERVEQHEKRFDRMWAGETSNVSVYSIPQGIRRDLIELRTTDERPYDLPDKQEASSTNSISLRDYQREAVDAWFANENRGLFEMATGTGKTYTALGALDELLSTSDEPVFVVISVPMRHLAPQWADSLADFGFTNPSYCYGSRNPAWHSDLQALVSDFKHGFSDGEIVITTHTTGAKEKFRTEIASIDGRTFIIGDEVHNMGSSHRKKGLLPGYDYRLGLSATPERYYDDEGSRYLLNYFGGTVYQFTLDDAIPEYLTEYYYYPRIVEMTPDELGEYRQYTHKIVKAQNKTTEDEDAVERLLQKRAQILKSAEQKFAELKDIVESVDVDHLLVYTNHEQIDDVQELLTDQEIIQHRFTATEDDDEREQLLEAFAGGKYDALVAMKCLDEGVDVPSTKQAIMMSNSKNPMQFVQRRGRVLRKDPESGKEHAEIYDMIVVPTMNPDATLLESEKNIIRKELDRFEEFVENAKNETSARMAIQQIRTEYQV
jgi:superfamily II DNA or RNA helicase